MFFGRNWHNNTATLGGIELNVDLIFKIAGVGMVVAILNQLLSRAGRDEQALLTTIAGLLVVLLMLSKEIGNLFDTLKTIFDL